MLDIGFPRHWSTLKKLMWLKAATGESPAYETASGAVASFEAKRAAPLQSLIVNIDPVQSGSGDPSPDNVRPITGVSSVKVNLSAYNMINQDYLLQASGWGKSTDSGFTSYGVHNAPVYKGSIKDLYQKFGTTSSYIPIANAKPGVSYVVGYRWRSLAAHSDYGIKMAVIYSDGTNSGWTTAQSANLAWTARIVTTPADKTPIGVMFNYNSYYWIYMTSLMCVEYDLYYAQPDTPQDRSFANDLTSVTVEIPTSPGTVYGGTLDVVSGTLTVDKAAVDLGSLSWTKKTGTQTAYFTANVWGIKPASSSTSPANILCSSYKPTGSTYVSYSAYPYSIGVTSTPSSSAIYVQDLRYTNKDDFTTAADGVILVYPLKTPLTYQLTPQEVNALKGQNNIWADTGNVSVTYRSN